MNVEEFREYCLSLPKVTEEFPFDDKILVFKVMGKMFSLANIEEFEGINIKASPEDAILQREKHEEVKPGYHMNKKHWNTVSVSGTLPTNLIKQWINDSYNLVIAKMPKKIREELGTLKS